MQKQFKYIYNRKEVNKEEFEKLSEGSFKWFSKQGIESVPFSSFDSFFNGEYRSGRQINDHLDSVLNVYQNKVTEDIINKPKCSPQCYCDGSCKKPQEKKLGGYNKPTIKGSSTRHKSQAGETHAENLVYVKEGTGYDYLKRRMKDDVITSSSRGEKETIEYLQGVKETEGVKLNKLKPQISLLFKQFPDALEAIAKCSEYGHKKYKETDADFLNFKRVSEGSKAYADAGLRHRLKKGIDLESMLPHCYHVAWNALAELQLLIEEK